MEPERRRQLLLGAVVIALAFAVYAALPRTSADPAPSSNLKVANPGAAASARKSPASPDAPDVHLKALEAEHPKPGPIDRNLFRFKPKPAPAPPPFAQPAQPTQTATPEQPPGPPPVPPITLKFIGLLKQAEGKPRIAVLSDSAGHVFHGTEGQNIEGRYRILKIGEESIEMSYIDGRGRQTIRLSGS
jgi:hypothetical protein